MRKKNQGPKISRYSSRHTATNMPPHIPMYCIRYMRRMYCNILNTVGVENFQRQDVLDRCKHQNPTWNFALAVHKWLCQLVGDTTSKFFIFF